MTLYTDDELLAANDAGMEWDHNRHDERTRAEAILDAVAPAIAARALREAAETLSVRTQGVDCVATSKWPDQDRATYALAIEDAESALRARADEIEAAP